MKKLFGFAIVAVLLVAPIVSFAAEFRMGNDASVQANEQVANDLYIAGKNVTSAGNITGDLVTAGGSVVVSGNVAADVVAAGGDVSILGSVGDDIRAAGGNITIAGSVGGDIVAGGGQITIGGSGVGGDAAIGGGDVRINAPVAGKLSFGGHSIYINAPIAGDIKIDADSVTLGSAAVISGTMTYSGKKELVKEAGAIVTGKINFVPVQSSMTSSLAPFLIILLIAKFFALLVCALVVGLVCRRYARELIVAAEARPLYGLGRGLVVLAVLFVGSIFLFITLVGVPFGILGFLFLLVGIIVAWIATPIVVGSVVYRYFSKKDLEVSWKTILLGVIICAILGIIPFIGWLALKLLFLLTLGAVDTVNWKILKDWK